MRTNRRKKMLAAMLLMLGAGAAVWLLSRPQPPPGAPAPAALTPEPPASTKPQRRAAVSPGTSARRPPPPFVAPGGSDSREERTACLRALIDAGGFDNLPFDHRPRSPRDQRLIAPMIQRILAAVTPAPSYTLDCHVGRCRLKLLVREHLDAHRSIKAVRRDRQLWATVGRLSGRFADPLTVTEVVTGAELQQYELYFDIPSIREPATDARPDDDLQVELPFSLAECRQRLAAARSEVEEARQEADKLSREARSTKHPAPSALDGFRAARPNPELTRRFAAVIDELRSDEPSLAGVVECRGERHCRWSSDLVESSVEFVMHELTDALDKRRMPADVTLGSFGEPGQPSPAWLLFRLRQRN